MSLQPSVTPVLYHSLFLPCHNTLVLHHGFLMYCCVRLSCWLPSATPRVSSNRSTWNMSCLTVWFRCPSSHNTLVLRHGFLMYCCVMLTRWLPFCCTSLQQQSQYMEHVMSDSLSNCLSSRNTLVLHEGFLMYGCVMLSRWLPSAAPCVSSNRSTRRMSCLTVGITVSLLARPLCCMMAS